MVDWKLYIDSPQKRALHACWGSLTEGDGWGAGGSEDNYSDGWAQGRGDGYNYGWGDGDGCGWGYGFGGGNGRSSTEW